MKNICRVVLTILLVFVITSLGVSQAKITKSFNVKKGENLSVKVSGDVKVESWSKDEVYIEVIGLDAEDAENLKMKQDGSTVSITLKNSDGASFSVKTPEQFNLDIKTSGGDLLCTGKVIGKISGTTAGGDVLVQNVDGNVVLTTAGGDVRTGDVSGSVKLTTAGGDILTGKIGGEGIVTTAGGDINIKDVGGEFKASTSGGDIRVGTVKGAAKLNTSGGDIKLSGANGKIIINTSGGDIKLDKIFGSVQAHTSGGDVYVELTPDGSDESSLVSSGGNIKLLIPENSKATIEAVIDVQSKKDLKEKYKVISDFKFESYTADEDDGEINATINLNGGGKIIKINTSNSNIEIRKLSK